MLAALHRTPPILISTTLAVGLLAYWLTGTAIGMLPPLGALFFYARGHLLQLLWAGLLVALAGATSTALLYPGALREAALSVGAFVAVAACIGALIARDPTRRGAGVEAVQRQASGHPGGFGAIPGDLSESAVHPDDRPAIAQAAAYAFWTGVPQVTGYRLRQPDGSYRWTELRAEPGYGVSVDVDAMVSRPGDRWTVAETFGTTIEAVKAAKVIESLHGKAWAFDAMGKFTYVTPAAQVAIDMALEDLNRRLGEREFIDGGEAGWMRGVHPEDVDRAASTLRHCLKTGEPWNIEYRMLRATGQYVWHRISARPTRDDEGAITGWFGTSIDIDVYKKTESALRAREQHLEQLIDTVPAMIWSMTGEGRPAYLNKRITEVTGSTLDTVTAPDGALSLKKMIHPDFLEFAEQAFAKSVTTGAPYNIKYLQHRADGTYRWTETRAEALRDETGKIVRWYGVSVDIHDLITTQTELHFRKQELTRLVDLVPSHIWRLTPAGAPNFFNRRFIDFLGLEEDGLETLQPDQFATALNAAIHPDDSVRLWAELKQCLLTGHPFSMRYRLRRHDGVYRWMDGRAEPLRDEGGTIIQWHGLSHDIDDQLRVEEALRESERSLRQLVETLPALIYCAAPNGEPIYRSEKLREFLGFGLGDKDEEGRTRLAGTLDAIIHPDDLPDVKEKYAVSLATGEPYAMKHRLRRADGAYRWVETRTAAMRNVEGEIVQWNGICFEIEDQVRAQEALTLTQERLARAAQAASLAELSASIAHEVNQPLAAVVANSHACQRWLTSDPPNLERAQKTVERIIRDANSAADVVGRVRALFRQTVQARNPCQLDAILHEARDLMTEEATRRRFRIEVEVEAGLPSLELDRIQIQQVLVNLIRNGMEAMEPAQRGTLRIRSLRAGDLVRTEVRDTGGGMGSPEKVFEPFFSTKPNGMGMGLAISRTIIETHGGRLWAENNQDGGATFVFTVDDDEALREALGELLAANGVRSTPFSSAGDYIGSSKPDLPACLILDVELPDINGLELQGQIAQADHPPIVFITGHGDIPSSVRAIKHGAVDFLTKPFSDTTLLAAIRTAIAQDRENRAKRAELSLLQQRYHELSPREREVLPLVVSGLLNKQAAAELGISEVTLQIHRRNVMQKMAASSLADLVRIAERLGVPIQHSRRMGGG
jgi:PAS domain S-box-containing protein